ncbi:MAG: zinc finger domain-containing protein, partial [Candidatus Daviesbacteria bacterium]|nr:zinc finger domain-containing protein [Candidatus Daviesbacteria bacterium]
VGNRFVGGHPTDDMMGKMPNSHTRVIFTFNDWSKLYFNDQRRFGWIKIIDNGQLKIDNSLNNLGPEPLEKEFSWEILKQNLLKHKSMPVKVAIMDQSVVSGVGNIYSNEACFNAKIDPRTKVGNLTDGQFKSLHQGVIKALKEGIRHGGSTKAHFVDPEGHKGYFLDYAFVYGLDKHPCKICKTIIKKIQLAGRGTYYCSKCQK